MTIKQYFNRGAKRSITGADVGDRIIFLASDEKNQVRLPKHTTLNKLYEIISVDELGQTRFLKDNGKPSISGCSPLQCGHYRILQAMLFF